MFVTFTRMFDTRKGRGVGLGQSLLLSLTSALWITCWDRVLAMVALLNIHVLSSSVVNYSVKSTSVREAAPI